MADVNLPSYQDYGTMMGMNPIAYQQAMQQQGLAQQFANESLQQSQAKTLADILANEQNQRMNPLRVQQLEGTNLGQQYKNRQEAITTDIAEKTKDQAYQLKVAELANKVTDEQLKAQEQKVWSMPRTTPQEEAAFQWEMGKIRDVAKKRDELRLTGANSLAVAKEHSRSAENVARINSQSREALAASKNRGVQTIADQVKSGKMTAEKAAVALYGAAQFESDPTEQQKLLKMASDYETFAMNQRKASSAGKVDVGAVANVPTVSIPPALGSGPKLGTAENPIKLD